MSKIEVNNTKRDDRVGETHIANNGMLMTIIEYHNAHNLVVKFEDGYIKSTDYTSFISGQVKNPNIDIAAIKEKYIGMKVKAHNGQIMECIDYFDNTNITVKFEDGTIVYNKTTSAFRKGAVSNPNRAALTGAQKIGLNNAEQYIGMTKTMSCGLNLTIIEYNNSHNVTGKWEDGIVSKFQIYKFLEGKVAHSESTSILTRYKNEREGKSFKLKDGHSVTVIKYNSALDVVVKFDDGSIDTTLWRYIQSGNVPKYHAVSKSKNIGKVYPTKFGITFTITNALSNKRYDILFEDGYRSTTCMHSIRKNEIKHPVLKCNKRIKYDYLGYTCSFVYSNDTDYYYACSCPKCGFDEILSVKEMVTTPHVCE